MLGPIAAGYDRFLDFAVPSPVTESKAPADTYDGSHYSREANARVVAALFAADSELAFDWQREDRASLPALYRQRLGQFIEKTTEAKAGPAR